MKNNLRYITFVMLLALSSLISSCKKDSIQNTPEAVSLYGIIENDIVNFSLLKAAVDRAGLKETLSSTTANLTLFAPSDEAFAAAGLNLGVINSLDPNAVKAVLEYHVIGNVLNLDDSFSSSDINTINNLSLFISTTNDNRFAVNGADVTNSNKKATNGILRVVNRVLIHHAGKSVYQQVNTNAELTFLAVALRRASTGTQNLVQQLNDAGTYTLFAPTNAAFIAAGYPDSTSIKNANAAVLTNILTYHLLNSKKYTVDMIDSLGTASVNQKQVYLYKRTVAPTRVSYTRGYFNGASFDRANANVTAINGVVHVIPELLTPPTLTLNQVIGGNTSLTYLAAAITRASQGTTNFTNLLSAEALHTIVAPTNAAFMAAGYSTILAVQNENPAVLAAILNNHLFTGHKFIFQFRNNTIVKPLSGGNLTVTINATSGAVSLAGGANTTAVTLTKSANFLNTNGILYTASQLLRP